MKFFALLLLLSVCSVYLPAQDVELDMEAQDREESTDASEEVAEELEATKEPEDFSTWSNIELDLDALFAEDQEEGAGVAPAVTMQRSPFSIRALIATKLHYRVDNSQPVLASVNTNLNFLYEDKNSQAAITFRFDSNYVRGTIDSTILWRQILREAHFKLFFGTMSIEVGLLRPAWAVDDVERTVDILSIQDSTSYMDLDGQASRLGQIMLRFHILSTFGMLEFNYMPIFLGDVRPEGSPWTTQREKDFYEHAGSNPVYAPPTDTPLPKHGQGAIRFTTSISLLDLGLAYSYNYLKQPVASLKFVPEDSSIFYQLYYDRSHIFSIDASLAFGPVIWSAYSAYYLNETVEDHIRFSSTVLANLQISNLQLILGTRGMFLVGENDADVVHEGPNEYYNRAIVSLILRDSYLGMIINPELGVAYDALSSDIMYQGSVKVLLHINASLTLRTVFFENISDTRDGPYSQYTENDFIELFFTYNF